MDEKWQGRQGRLEEIAEMLMIKSRRRGPVPEGAGPFYEYDLFDK